VPYLPCIYPRIFEVGDSFPSAVPLVADTDHTALLSCCTEQVLMSVKFLVKEKHYKETSTTGCVVERLQARGYRICSTSI